MSGGACAKPCPPLTPDATAALRFVSQHCTRHVRVSGMGDVLGFDYGEIDTVAGWLGIEIGEEELELIGILEDEYREYLKAERERAKKREQTGIAVEDDDLGDEGDDG